MTPPVVVSIREVDFILKNTRGRCYSDRLSRDIVSILNTSKDSRIPRQIGNEKNLEENFIETGIIGKKWRTKRFPRRSRS